MTVPASMRRKLGLEKAGGVPRIEFDERRHELIISKPIDVGALSERISRHSKPHTKPLLGVDEYYQTHRKTGA